MYYNNIVGYQNIKNEFDVIIDVANNRDKYLSKGTRWPRGVLLYGDPGLGKTLFATTVMEMMTNRKSYIIRKEDSSSNFFNYLKNTLDDALKNTPSVVLLDDFDKFSTESNRANNKSDEFSLVQTYIDKNIDKDIIFIATLNDIGDIPYSLLRPGRFDYNIEIQSPSVIEAKEIFEYYFKNKDLADDIDYWEIANLFSDETCSSLENIINKISINSIYKGRNKICRDDLFMEYINQAFLHSSYKLSEDSINHVAYHEAGHVLIAEILNKKEVVVAAINKQQGFCEGLTLTSTLDPTEANGYLFKEDYNYIIERIKYCLAGKASVDVFLHTDDTGCESDLKKAVRLLYNLYSNICPKTFKYIDINIYDHILSQERENNIQKEIAVQLENYYEEVKELLLQNKEKLFSIVNLLKERPYITQKELMPIMN